MILASFVILVVVVLLLIKIFRKSATDKDIPPEPSNQEILAKKLAIDSDNDGLVDWEETLWQTDENNPDTDGDGAKDGQEVKLGRDPNKAGPDDVYAKLIPPESSDSNNTHSYQYQYNAELGTTLTDKLSRNLFLNYVQAKSAGLYNTDTNQTIADGLSDEFSGAGLYTNITEKNLRTTINTELAVRNYLNSVGAILEAIKNALGDEFAIINEALDTNDNSSLSLLMGYENNYKAVLNKILNLSVPSDLIPEHLELARVFDTLAQVLSIIRKANNDLVLVMRELGRYGAVSDSLATIYDNYAFYTETRGIKFTANEKASLFLTKQ